MQHAIRVYFRWLLDRIVSMRPKRPPAVGVFGKHPAFGDHITLPLPDPALRRLWHTLYGTCIRAVIEQGTWTAFESNGNAVPWGHWFCTGRGGTWIVGRLWESSDAIGRREYPMAAAIAFHQTTPAAAVHAAAPVLPMLQSQCTKATSVEAVIAATAAAQQALAGFQTDPRQLSSVAAKAFHIFDRHRAAAGFDRVAVSADALSTGALIQQIDSAGAEHGRTPEIFVARPDGRPWVDRVIGPLDGRSCAALRSTAVYTVSD